MKAERSTKLTFEELDRLAHDTSDIKPLSPKSRQKWEAAKRTGTKVRTGRPLKDPKFKSRIVPISITPDLLEKVDRFSKSAGISRSGLVAEALRMRMAHPPSRARKPK